MEINSPSSDHSLGIVEMDSTHNEFLVACEQLKAASGGDFVQQFATLVDHTRDHFNNENRLMEESGFPPIHIHQGEHARVIGELEQAAEQLKQNENAFEHGAMVDGLLEWFEMHLRTMDAALAGHLRNVNHPAASNGA